MSLSFLVKFEFPCHARAQKSPNPASTVASLITQNLNQNDHRWQSSEQGQFIP